MPTKQLSITLPEEMADMVRAKVASGRYGTESDVVQDGLLALQQHDEAVEVWLRDEVVPAYDAMKADPTRAISVEEIRARLAEEHDRRARKSG